MLEALHLMFVIDSQVDSPYHLNLIQNLLLYQRIQQQIPQKSPFDNQQISHYQSVYILLNLCHSQFDYCKNILYPYQYIQEHYKLVSLKEN